MNLATLFDRLPFTVKSWTSALTAEVKDKSFRSICTHHLQVQEQDLFVALSGAQFDAHRFLTDVDKVKPVLMVTEKKIPNLQSHQLVVPSTRLFLAHLADAFYDHPSREMFCFGVTGTNGKTSSTYMMAHLFDRLSLPCGVIGTIEHRLEEKTWETTHTTPDPLSLQSRLREMRTLGARALAMEVSSHALDQQRVAGMSWDTVLFTNLSQDHLDYHKTMENYLAAKERLFTDHLEATTKTNPLAVVNIDQAWGSKLKVNSRAEVMTYGLGAQADYQLLSSEFIGSGRSTAKIRTPYGVFNAELPIVGQPFLLNLIGVVACASALGVSTQTALQVLSQFSGVPGRFQRVIYESGQKNVYIDYAHTPDAVERILLEGQKLKKSLGGRVIALLGCGGDRDRTKRPLMGKKACEGADLVYITSDNPRSEDPEKIIAEILPGCDTSRVVAIVDRREAIGRAIAECSDLDHLFILGKGHERTPFRDYDIAYEFLQTSNRKG